MTAPITAIFNDKPLDPGYMQNFERPFLSMSDADLRGRNAARRGWPTPIGQLWERAGEAKS